MNNERHPAVIVGAMKERIDRLYRAAMEDSTPAIHDHYNRIEELHDELLAAITRRELEMSLAAKCEEIGGSLA